MEFGTYPTDWHIEGDLPNQVAVSTVRVGGLYTSTCTCEIQGEGIITHTCKRVLLKGEGTTHDCKRVLLHTHVRGYNYY